MKERATRRTRTALASLLAATLLLPAPALSVEGVDFARTLQLGNASLRLLGTALLRYKVIFKAYAAGLYLGEGVPADRALDDVPRRLEIEYFWDIPAEGFVQATNEGIAKNVDADTFTGLRPRIDRFNDLYTDVGPGDRYALTYLPGVGTELAKNGTPLGRIEGADFAAALFSIWLGDEPFDATLKSRLLGRSG